MNALTQLEKKNIYHLYSEIAWFGIFVGSLLSFWGVYAARIGASSFEIGLLSSVPGIVNLVISLPSAVLINKGYSDRISYVTSIFARVVYVVLIFLPLLESKQIQIWGIVLIAFFYSIPNTILTISANVMLAEVLPLEFRATVIGRRYGFYSLSTVVSLFTSGILLDKVPFPLNYQIVFALGVLGLAGSTYHLGCVYSDRWLKDFPKLNYWRPDVILQRTKAFIKMSREELSQFNIRKLLRFDLLRGSFGKIIAAYLVFYTIMSFPGSVFTLFLVKTIHVSDGVISIGNSIYYVGMFVFSMLLGPLSKKIGQRGALVLGAFMYMFYPLLGSLANGPAMFYFGSAIGGIACGLNNGALVTRLYERTPVGEQPASMAFNNMVMNIGSALGVTLGAWLGTLIGFRDALFWSGALRIIGAAFLFFWA